jgi:hypothetical protein
LWAYLSRWIIVIYTTITEEVSGNEILESQAPSTVQYKIKVKRNTSKRLETKNK